MKKTYPVDRHCISMAELFLSDVKGATSEDHTELAEAIQRLCEDFCHTIETSEARIRGAR